MNKELFYINNKMSIPIESYLNNCDSYEEFEKAFTDELIEEDCQISNYLNTLLRKYNIPDSVASDKAGFSLGYVNKIISGKNKNPKRDTLIRICLAIGATLEETQFLLKYSGHAPLYVRRKRDVIIWFGLMKHESLDDVDNNLIQRGLKPLFTLYVIYSKDFLFFH